MQMWYQPCQSRNEYPGGERDRREPRAFQLRRKNLPAFWRHFDYPVLPEGKADDGVGKERTSSSKSSSYSQQGKSTIAWAWRTASPPSPLPERSLRTDREALRGEALPSHPLTLLDDTLDYWSLSVCSDYTARFLGKPPQKRWLILWHHHENKSFWYMGLSGPQRNSAVGEKKLPPYLTWGFLCLYIPKLGTRLLYASIQKNSHCRKTAPRAPKHCQSSASLPQWNDLVVSNADQCSPLSLCETPVSIGACQDQFSQDHYLSYIGNLQLAKWKHLALLCSPPGELRSHPGTTCSYILIQKFTNICTWLSTSILW